MRAVGRVSEVEKGAGGREEPREGWEQGRGYCHPRVGMTRARKGKIYIPYLSTQNSDGDPVGNSPFPHLLPPHPPKLYKS